MPLVLTSARPLALKSFSPSGVIFRSMRSNFKLNLSQCRIFGKYAPVENWMDLRRLSLARTSGPVHALACPPPGRRCHGKAEAAQWSEAGSGSVRAEHAASDA